MSQNKPWNPDDAQKLARVERMEAALLAADVGFWEADLANDTVLLDNRCKELYGLREDQVLTYTDALKQIHAEDIDMFQLAVNHAFDSHTDGKYDIRYRVIGYNGLQVRWVQAKGRVYFNDQHQPIRFLGIAQEIGNSQTTLFNKKQAVHKSQQRLHNLFDEAPELITNMVLTAPIGICVIDAATLFPQVVNESFSIIADRTAQQLLGNYYWDVLPEIKELYEKVFQKVVDTGEPYHSDDVALSLNRHGNTEIAHVNFVYAPIKNSEGIVEKVAVWVVENTPQVLARQQADEAEAVMRDAVDLAELATWNIDFRTGSLNYSKRMYDWYGYNPNGENFMNIFPLIDTADRQRVQDGIADLVNVAGSDHWEDVFSMVHLHSGRKRILSAHGRKIRDNNGVPIKVVGSAQDITVQRELRLALEMAIQERTEELDASNEELLSANEELAATNEELAQLNEELGVSNQDLQQFAHVTSHDLKEPLRKLKTFLSRVEADPLNSFSPQSKGWLERISVSAARMSAMIEGVLKYSMINAGGSKVEPVNLSDIFKSILLDLEVLIDLKHARIEYEEMPVIEGTSVLLYQLFYNLIINALKFSREDPSPVIRVRVANITRNGVPIAQIDIDDNGIGFDARHAQNIFNTFVRLNSKDAYEGTGLGLALCKKIVMRHSGSIEASGEMGKGASFIVTLPYKQPIKVL